MWWRMFDRAEATPEELRDDPGCIEGIQAVGSPAVEKLSLVQAYSFAPEQECKLAAGDKTDVMFSFNLEAKLKLIELDASAGTLALGRLARRGWPRNLAGAFPQQWFRCCPTNMSRPNPFSLHWPKSPQEASAPGQLHA